MERKRKKEEKEPVIEKAPPKKRIEIEISSASDNETSDNGVQPSASDDETLENRVKRRASLAQTTVSNLIQPLILLGLLIFIKQSHS